MDVQFHRINAGCDRVVGEVVAFANVPVVLDMIELVIVPVELFGEHLRSCIEQASGQERAQKKNA